MNEDLSAIFEKFNINKDSISPEMIENIMGMLKNNSNDNCNNDENNSSDFNIDIDTILRLKPLFEALNKKDDPRSKLLLSLKPYLRKSRQSKLDQYIQLGKILQVLPFINGDENVKK